MSDIMNEVIKNVKIECEFVGKMTQFEDIIPTLMLKRVGDKAKIASKDNGQGGTTSFVSYEIDEQGNEVQVSYDYIKGLSNEQLISFFTRAYQKEIEDYPNLSLSEFLMEQQQYFELLLNCEYLQGYHALMRSIVKFLTKEPKQIENVENPPTRTAQETPKAFEDLFYNPEHAEPCLEILRELHPPFIDAHNNYIGKSKGIFPLWIKVLKSHRPAPLIKPFRDSVYKDLLNTKVKGLNLTEDASEFRKHYSRLVNSGVELDIKTILSQYSQSGKLGK